MDPIELLEAHLNVWWLRPESIAWDSIASYLIREHGSLEGALDLGSGNGIFSFITAGGRFGVEFDWFVQAGPEMPLGSDIYDAPPRDFTPSIVRAPDYHMKVALDYKRNLLDQAALLGLYDKLVQHDANSSLPFPDGMFPMVFSNILYWLREPANVMRECLRVLADDGRAIFCIPDPLFFTFCESYRWRELKSEYLHLVNRGRDACIRWTATRAEFEKLAKDIGFHTIAYRNYLQRHTLFLFDMQLCPTSRPLIKMANKLTHSERAAFKQEWMSAIRPILSALLEEELKIHDNGGFHVFVLEKTS